MKVIAANVSHILLLLLVVACTGIKARDEVLLPIAQEVWANVQLDFRAGVLAGLESGDLSPAHAELLAREAGMLTAALAGGDRSSLLQINWEWMVPWAVRGVEVGGFSPGVTAILMRRIERFGRLIEVLRERT